MSPKDKILDKLAKLAAKAESAAEIGNQAEAEAFAAKVQELLLRHQIADWEVVDAQGKLGGKTLKDRVVQKWWRAEDYGLTYKRKRSAWAENLGSFLAHSFDCQMRIVTGSNTVVFYGIDDDVEVLCQLYATLLTKLEKMSQRSYDREYAKRYDNDLPTWDMRGYRKSYLDGAVSGIAKKLRTQKNDIEETTGTTLIVVKKDTVREWLKDHDSKRKNKVGNAEAIGGNAYNPNGYRKGFQDGLSTSIRPELKG
jgi:hypothetical protein